MARGQRKSIGSQPQGGWLRRISTGAAAAFSDGGGDDRDAAAAPPHMTPRMEQIGHAMLKRWQADPDAWFNARNITEDSGVPQGTTQPLIMRYQASEWVETKLDNGARLYRLRSAGAHGLASHFKVESAPRSAVVDAAMRREAEASVRLDGETIDVGPVTIKPSAQKKTAVKAAAKTAAVPVQRNKTTKDDKPKVLPQVQAAPPGKRGWTAAELGELNPDLLAAVRRKLFGGSE